ncbi:MAG: hypothetical protein KY476_09955 [Planctomycetes bacterium]|nr:hypothetical protein [Planctomycetota bacterium]
MADGRCVLVVDGLPETGEVLQAVLEPRGIPVRRLRRGDAPEEPLRPSVLVLDHDDLPMPPDEFAGVPQVIVGSIHLPPAGLASQGRQYLRKPFEYAELIRAVEKLAADTVAETVERRAA